MNCEIETDRLRLKRFVEGDAAFIVSLLNQPSFLRFIGDKGVRTLEDAQSYIRNGPIKSYQEHGFGLYLVELKSKQLPIGMCGLLKRDSLPNVDLGFAFLPEFWREGYAHEAASAVLAHAQNDLGLERILAIANPDNDASIRLLEKLGFKFETPVKLSNETASVKLFSHDVETS